MADSAAHQRKANWAARLWGAAERQGEDPKAYRTPIAPTNRSQLLATVRASLGEAGFAAAWAAGRALTPEEALAAPDTVGHNLAPTGAGSALAHAAPWRPAGLTHRELEVLLLVAEGLSNTQIAERLVISVATVKTYLSAIYDKLGVLSRTAAMRYVIDHRLE
jgi:DNA-binding NarL/FixJ family response regulator